MDLEIIVNNKVADNGEAVIQLETAVGAAVKHFERAIGVNVPRSRFLPVKSCSDLLLITSDLYELQHGRLLMNEKRLFQSTPVVKLGDHFKKVAAFQKRFKTIPEVSDWGAAADVRYKRQGDLKLTLLLAPSDGRVGPLDCRWRCLVRSQRHASRNGCVLSYGQSIAPF